MFKKRNRKCQSRPKDEIIDLVQDDNEIIEIDIPCPKPNKDKLKPKPSAILSFENEEAEETFKIKRPNHSKRIAKQLKKERKEEKYKNKKDSYDSPVEHDAYRNPGKGYEPEKNASFAVSKPIIPKAPKGFFDAEFKEFDDGDSAHSDSEIYAPAIPKNPLAGIIPDAITINEIRRKRQQMAHNKTKESNYINLNKKDDERSSTRENNSTSRLVREEDHDHSDEDEDILGTTRHRGLDSNGKSVSFNTMSRETKLRSIQRKIIAAEQEDTENMDHDNHWEFQQIHKATGQQISTEDMYSSSPSNNRSGKKSSKNNDEIYLKDSFSSIVSQMKGMTIGEAKHVLSQRLKEMKAIHEETTNQRNNISSQLEKIKIEQGSKEEEEAHKEKTDKTYRFYQETHSYFLDLISCLNSKMPAIECIDRGYTSIQTVRSAKNVARSRLDMKEESLMHSSKQPDLNKEEMEKRQQRNAEREGRRSRRKRARIDAGVNVDHEDGTSTDDEISRSQSVKYHTEKERLNMEHKRIFEDVCDNFSTCSQVVSYFIKWRQSEPSSYSDAYISLCLPKIMVPFAKFECCAWHPLKDDISSIQNHRWFKALLQYHRQATLDSRHKPLEDDYNAIPSVVNKVILPKITVFIEKVWIPASSKETNHLATLISDLRNEYPNVNDNNKNTQLMIKAIVVRLKDTIDEDIYIPLMSKDMVENRKLDTSVYFYRQFWSTVKIYNNILLLREILSAEVLKQLAVSSVLCRYITMALSSLMRSSSPRQIVELCEMLIEEIPLSWFKLPDENLQNSLRQFHFVLEHLAGIAYSQIIPANDESHKASRSIIKRILTILRNINAKKSFKDICEKYSIKLT